METRPHETIDLERFGQKQGLARSIYSFASDRVADSWVWHLLPMVDRSLSLIAVIDSGAPGSAGWAARPGDAASDAPVTAHGNCVASLLELVVHHIEHGVALGVESPIFLPCPDDTYSGKLTRAIDIDPGVNRPWTAAAGPGSTVVGLVILGALMRGVAAAVPETVVTTDPDDAGSGRLWFFEAFISGPAKRHSGDHLGDAACAVWAASLSSVADHRVRSDAPTEDGKMLLHGMATAAILNMPLALALHAGLQTSGDPTAYRIVRPRQPAPPSVYAGLRAF